MAPTITASPVIQVTPVASGSAVYLELGDGAGALCCQPFADYVSGKLGRSVQTVNLATEESSVDFVAGVNHVRPSQLDNALAAIAQYSSANNPVVAVTLSLGRADFEQQVAACGDASDNCKNAFQTNLIAPFEERLEFIMRQISAAGTAPPPVFILNYFDPKSCPGQAASDYSIADVNSAIAQAAGDNDASVVDLTQDPDGCADLAGATPSAAGAAFIEKQLEAAYDAEASSQGQPSPS